MNTPNKLTVMRMVMVPAFMALLLCKGIPYHMFWAAVIFAAASITDTIDGKLARSRNQITNFGKLMDPLADKLLVTSALVCFAALGISDAWSVMIIIARDFLVTSIRLIAAGTGDVLPANMWGKVKTVSQMCAVILTLLIVGFGGPEIIGFILIWIAAGFTVVSGVQYVWSYRKYIGDAR